MKIKFKNGWWKITQDTRNFIISKRYKNRKGEFEWEPMFYFNSLKGVANRLLKMQALDMSEYKDLLSAIDSAENAILEKLDGIQKA